MSIKFHQTKEGGLVGICSEEPDQLNTKKPYIVESGADNNLCFTLYIGQYPVYFSSHRSEVEQIKMGLEGAASLGYVSFNSTALEGTETTKEGYE